jgi:hypothetical protein
MKTKTIIILIIIVVLIYFGYKMNKENINDDMDCKWTDEKGVVYNSDKSDCYKCYKCENENTNELALRTSCIKAGKNKEKDLGFHKYHKLSVCANY